MNWGALAIIVVFAAFMGAMMWFLTEHYEKWSVRLFTKRSLSDWTSGLLRTQPRLESDYSVVISENDVTCTHPNGNHRLLLWSDLVKVELWTTDEGPINPDRYWVLTGKNHDICLVPVGATGEDELMDRLQALPGFRNDVVSNAMCLTDNNRLVCWERTDNIG